MWLDNERHIRHTSRSPVDIQLPVVWQVIVDDKRDLLYVYTTCPDIGGDQHTTTQTYHNPQRSQKGAVHTVHTHIPVTAHTTHTDQPNMCILHHSLQASRTFHRTSAELHRKRMVPVTQASVKTATRFGQNTDTECAVSGYATKAKNALCYTATVQHRHIAVMAVVALWCRCSMNNHSHKFQPSG